MRRFDDLLKMIHVTLNGVPEDARAVFYLRFSKEFKQDIEKCMKKVNSNS